MYFFYSLLNPGKYNGKKRKDNPAVATIMNENNQQVKTYMDNSNGVRNANSNAYNKVINNFIFYFYFFTYLNKILLKNYIVFVF